MSLDKNRILVECDCGLIFRLAEKDIPLNEKFCGLVPEKDLGNRKKACHNFNKPIKKSPKK